MKDGGYFKLYRRAFRDVDHGGDPLWNEHRVWSRAEAWLYLLAIAAHGPHDKPLKGGAIVHLERGEFYASLRYLGRHWGWSKNKVAKFLSDLVSTFERISPQKRDAHGDTYLVVKYDYYQDTRDSRRDVGGTRAGQARDKREEGRRKVEEEEEKNAPAGASARRQATLIPPDLAAVDGFRELWMQRLADLPSSGRPTKGGQRLQLKQMQLVLAKHGASAVIAAVEEAINRKWTGFKADWVNGSSRTLFDKPATRIAARRADSTEAAGATVTKPRGW